MIIKILQRRTSSKKVDLEGYFVAGVNLSEAQNLKPPPTHSIRVYSILIHTGKQRREGGEGEELNQREGGRGNRGEYRSHS
jgi:hypothetical protein